jgi:hypothetical protein
MDDLSKTSIDTLVKAVNDMFRRLIDLEAGVALYDQLANEFAQMPGKERERMACEIDGRRCRLEIERLEKDIDVYLDFLKKYA